MKNVLVLGGGFTADKRLDPESLEFYIYEPTRAPTLIATIDANNECEPTFVHDLDHTPWPACSHKDHFREYEEIHAYEIFEHLGAQGNAPQFFSTFNECYRVLKRGGRLLASVPSYKSVWAWGDPSHTRIINAGSLTFLMRTNYEKQIDCERAKRTAMSDYRHLLVGDWKLVNHRDDGESYRFVLETL